MDRGAATETTDRESSVVMQTILIGDVREQLARTRIAAVQPRMIELAEVT